MISRAPSQEHMRWWDLPAALLIFAALLTATFRLSTTDWTENLSQIQFLAVIGLVLGLAIGQSTFSRVISTVLALAFGTFFIPWQLGLTMGKNILWSERVISLAGRLSTSAVQLVERKPVNDPLLFLFFMSLLFWLLSVHAGYTLTRFAHPWQATLPTGLALFLIHIHDPYWPYRTWFVATYIFFALLLLARTTYLHHYEKWRRANTRLPPFLGLDLIRTTLIATIIIVLLAWTAPALANSVPLAERAWEKVSRPWVIARSRMSNAFSSLRASVGLTYDYYGDVFPLGRGNRLTDDLLLTVEAPPRPGSVMRYYWRARVYDNYERGLWTGNYDETIAVSPQNFDLNLPELDGRQSLTFDLTPHMPLSTLFIIPQPEWVSRPVRADLAINPDGTVDLGALHAEVNVQPGETYQVRAALSAVTESELRNAGTEYPDWVLERYIQLPSTVTPRTKALAQEITDQFDNPYDKTVAVTKFLRENITYSDTIPIPPSEQDPVDWVLFDLKQGFCNYYATAEIVLLRSVGIPARWAVGYAQGEYNELTATYQVRQRDAHAWPEVYFPEIGWVEFEPTVSQPVILRPAGGGLNEAGDPENSSDPGLSPNLDDELERLLGLNEENMNASTTPVEENLLITFFLPAVALVMILISLFSWRRGRLRVVKRLPMVLETGMIRIGIQPPQLIRRWAHFARLSPLTKAYNELNRALARLGAKPGPHETPAERASSLETLLPDAAEPTKKLIHEYQGSTYGLRSGNIIIAHSAGRAIRSLSWSAWFRRLVLRKR